VSEFAGPAGSAYVPLSPHFACERDDEISGQPRTRVIKFAGRVMAFTDVRNPLHLDTVKSNSKSLSKYHELNYSFG
jgi:hypothetical protein